MYTKSPSHVLFCSRGHIDPTVTGDGNLAVEALTDQRAIRTAFDEEGIVEESPVRSLQSGRVQLGMVELVLGCELVWCPDALFAYLLNSELTIFNA